MNYRTEIISLNCVQKSDFVVMYRTLMKLSNKWENNHYLMVKCSKMLAKANSSGRALDLSSICHWISKYVATVLNVYEVRSLVKYVNIIADDKRSRSLGYCDLYPPSNRDYDTWCANLFTLANRKIAIAKQKESVAFKEKLDKLEMIATDKRHRKKKRKKKVEFKVGSHKQTSTPSKSQSYVIHEMFPNLMETKSQSTDDVTPPPSKKKSRHNKRKKILKSSSTKEVNADKPALLPVRYNNQNSANPGFDNFSEAVVETQVKKHAKKQMILTTKLPDIKSSNDIDYSVSPISRLNKDKKKFISRAVSFNDQVDKEFFGEDNFNPVVDKLGMLHEGKASRIVKERQKFKLESQRVKNEVFATLGL